VVTGPTEKPFCPAEIVAFEVMFVLFNTIELLPVARAALSGCHVGATPDPPPVRIYPEVGELFATTDTSAGYVINTSLVPGNKATAALALLEARTVVRASEVLLV
jgi:hypothetical protein